jgi:hypothetical protein
MKNYLSTLDLAIWLSLIAGRLLLCVCILKRRVLRRLPFFSIFAFASTTETLLLWALAYWATYSAYYYTFYITGHLVSALAFVTLIQCGRQVLPGLKLPQRERALAWLLVAWGAVVIFAVSWPQRFIENRIEVGACLAIGITFIFLAAYSRYLGLYWSRLLAGISSTLGLLYLVEGAAYAVMGHYPSALLVQVRLVSQIANVLAVIAWIVIILSPWGEYRLTPDQLRALKRTVDEIEANLRDFAEEAERVA